MSCSTNDDLGHFLGPTVACLNQSQCPLTFGGIRGIVGDGDSCQLLLTTWRRQNPVIQLTPEKQTLTVPMPAFPVPYFALSLLEDSDGSPRRTESQGALGRNLLRLGSLFPRQLGLIALLSLKLFLLFTLWANPSGSSPDCQPEGRGLPFPFLVFPS